MEQDQTYKYLSDSNLEWGQSTNDLEKYLAEHPGTVFASDDVRPGVLIVSANDLVRVVENRAKYAWLRNNFEPEGTIAYYYFVYDITPAEIAKLCASSGYCR